MLHHLVILIYLVLPVGAIVWAVYRGWRDPRSRPAALSGISLLATASIVIGVAASIIYGMSLGGVVGVRQMVLTAYFVAGLICLLKLFDGALDLGTRALFAVGRGTFLAAERRSFASVLRITILFGIGMPYMIVAALTFHPKAVAPEDRAWTKLNAQPVQFKSSDGLNLAGLWITPGDPSPGKRRRNWARETVIICHGQLDNKSSYPELAAEFAAAGYNVLTFDFRAFGQSDGQIFAFGDTEQRDVLAAVQWVQTNFPNSSRKIHGIGIGTGGAALLAAAADQSPQGRAIDSLVVCGCYDRFDSLVDSASGDYFAPTLRWLTRHFGVALASLQTGADLSNFSPEADALSIAPRPIMFIHGRKDRLVRFELGENLFDAASAPKTNLWLDDAEDDAITMPHVAAKARKFIELAVPML